MDRKIKLSNFSSYSFDQTGGFDGDKFRRESPPKRRRLDGAAYILIKLGLCAAMCGIILALALSRAPAAEDTLASLKYAANDDKQADETLGQLKLVSLPSILEVFSPSDSPIMPVESEDIALSSGSYIAAIHATPGDRVRSSLGGTVKAISSEPNLGGYVIIEHEGDVELTYYGLSDISVEVGQPVTQNSTIGIVESGTLYFGVTCSGRPADPIEFLGARLRDS